MIKLDYDGDDILYKGVIISPWLYHDEILYSLDDDVKKVNVTNDCGSISEAIRIIDKYRTVKNVNQNFNFFAQKFKEEFGEKVMFTDFGPYKQILFMSKHCDLLAVSEHSVDHPDAVKNRANGAIVICHDSGSMYWNSNANKVFEFPCNKDEYNDIIKYIKKIGKKK